MANLDLDVRRGWPDELRALLERHPRSAWASHRRHSLASFWLERHRMFRDQASVLRAATLEYLEARMGLAEYQRWLAPNLQAFLSHLHGHHQVEDHHYFPAFRASEPRLAAGFETLDQDHRHLDRSIAAVVETARQLLRAAPRDAAPGERFAAASERLRRQLLRHLDDEEDLIIPVMLEHGG